MLVGERIAQTSGAPHIKPSAVHPQPDTNGDSGDIPNQSLAPLTTKMHIRTALQFFAQREPKATRRFILDLIKEFYPSANPSYGNARALYIIGKTSSVNMRYVFRKNILTLARAYIANHER
jgi:hypothetical protein